MDGLESSGIDGDMAWTRDGEKERALVATLDNIHRKSAMVMIELCACLQAHHSRLTPLFT